MKKLRVDEWKPIDDFTLESSVDAMIRSNENMLVSAGPGTGKTEMLAQKASFLLTTENGFDVRRILAISFKKDAAYNLLDRVVKRCGEDARRQFTSRTYDAFAKMIVDRFRNVLPPGMRPTRNYVAISSTEAARRLSEHSRNDISAKTLDNNIEYADLVRWDTDSTCRLLTYLFHDDEKGQSYLPFKFITQLAIHIVKIAPLVREGLRCAYSHIMLDEFQDTTNLQYQLVKACFGGYGHGVTAVGDLNQRIMGWAGARKDVFDAFKSEFNAVNTELTINHRSLPKLVALQRLVHDKLFNGQIQSCSGTNGVESAGVIKLLKLKNQHEEARHLIREILADICSGIKPREICILCRVQVEGFINSLRSDLKIAGLEIRNEGTFQELLKSPIVKLVQDIVDLAYNRRQAELKFSVLRSMMDIRGLNVDNVQQRMCCVKTLNELLERIVAIGEDKDDGCKIERLICNVVGLFGEASIKRNFAEYRHSDERYTEDLLEYTNWMNSFVNQASGNLYEAMKKFRGDNDIPIMTIHKSKGLEYRSVYFIGLEDRKFWNFDKNPDEELCSMYVAMSRAKEKLVFSFCETRDMQWQSHTSIDSFFSLLQESPLVEVVEGTDVPILPSSERFAHN